MIPLRASGLLGEFATAGVLIAADVHVATRLGALTGETDERALLAAALTVRGTRQGSVVLDLDSAADTITPDADEDDVREVVELPWPPAQEWVAAVRASPLVSGTAGGPPLQLVGPRLWLDRYWRQEVLVADELARRSADPPEELSGGDAALATDLDELFTDEDADQRAAVEVAVRSRVSVIAGGPGTGKTTTVARLITVLRRRLGDSVRIALAAPTAVAATRLETAVREASGLPAADRAALAGVSASTLHRLLGWLPGSRSRFRHDRDNRLPYDVVIVDECSMVSLTLMARLLEALPERTRLVLVGDPDQLASVEAGAVLGDIVGEPADSGTGVDEPAESGTGAVDEPVDSGTGAPATPPGPGDRLRASVTVLRRDRRFDADGSIALLASLVRAGRADDVLALLRERDELVFHEVPDGEPITGAALADLQAAVLRAESAAIHAAADGDVRTALDALDRHRVLCAHRAGPRGVRHWADAAQRWLAPVAGPSDRADGRYPGQPLLVTSNDYDVELFNGDYGIVVRDGDRLKAAFRRGDRAKLVDLVRLGDVRPLHAMTVHRAQGSQFAEVTVVLPLADSPLATRQTFYTAVTRASQRVRLIGSPESVLACVSHPAARATGLRARLEGELVPESAGR